MNDENSWIDEVIQKHKMQLDSLKNKNSPMDFYTIAQETNNNNNNNNQKNIIEENLDSKNNINNINQSLNIQSKFNTLNPPKIDYTKYSQPSNNVDNKNLINFDLEENIKLKQKITKKKDKIQKFIIRTNKFVKKSIK